MEFYISGCYMEVGNVGKENLYQQFGETSGSRDVGSARQFVSDLIRRQRLNVGTISEYCLMWSDLAADTVRRRTVSSDVHQAINNISLGIDFLAFTKRYEQLSPGHRSYIPQKFSEIRLEEGIDQVTLSYRDAKLLQMAAASVNIPYDPGEPENTPENIEKRTFKFAEIEGMLPTTNVVDAGK
jgi:hypothetical protein